MNKLCLSIMAMCVSLASCTSYNLPAFSTQRWHVDSRTGNAVSTSGLELAFGSPWMITDTALMQSTSDIAASPKLGGHLARGMARFPGIAVDSVLFYNPHRGLLFVTYHQEKPLRPDSEIYLYDDSSAVYSPEYARIFGNLSTYIDDTGWESGPSNSVYSNVYYRPASKSVVLLQRLPPYRGNNIAVFQIWATDNISRIAPALHSAQSLAVSNLRLALSSPR